LFQKCIENSRFETDIKFLALLNTCFFEYVHKIQKANLGVELRNCLEDIYPLVNRQLISNVATGDKPQVVL
jgi:hypothetical protein